MPPDLLGETREDFIARITAGNPDIDALEPRRLECEAKYVLSLPGREARNEWIAKVAKKGTPEEASRLKAEVMRIWTTRNSR